MRRNILNVLYIDNHILAVNKPPGIPVQGDISGDPSLFAQAKTFIKQKYKKPGNVYLALIHRIDRPASGVVLFARTSKAAGRLSEQLRENTMKKIYTAIVDGCIDLKGEYRDYIVRKAVNSYISQSGIHGKYSTLTFSRQSIFKNQSLVKIYLKTGRHHQIRVQFSHRGHPIIGDFRYGSKRKFPGKALALHAKTIQFQHPTLKKETIISAEFPMNWNQYMNTGEPNWTQYL